MIRSFKDVFRTSRLNSLPRKLPGSAEDYPTLQHIESTRESKKRLDWGLKRYIPKNSAKSIVVENLDTYEQLTIFGTAAKFQSVFDRFQASNIPIREKPPILSSYSSPESDLASSHNPLFPYKSSQVLNKNYESNNEKVSNTSALEDTITNRRKIKTNIINPNDTPDQIKYKTEILLNIAHDSWLKAKELAKNAIEIVSENEINTKNSNPNQKNNNSENIINAARARASRTSDLYRNVINLSKTQKNKLYKRLEKISWKFNVLIKQKFGMTPFQMRNSPQHIDLLHNEIIKFLLDPNNVNIPTAGSYSSQSKHTNPQGTAGLGYQLIGYAKNTPNGLVSENIIPGRFVKSKTNKLSESYVSVGGFYAAVSSHQVAPSFSRALAGNPCFLERSPYSYDNAQLSSTAEELSEKTGKVNEESKTKSKYHSGVSIDNRLPQFIKLRDSAEGKNALTTNNGKPVKYDTKHLIHERQLVSFFRVSDAQLNTQTNTITFNPNLSRLSSNSATPFTYEWRQRYRLLKNLGSPAERKGLYSSLNPAKQEYARVQGNSGASHSGPNNSIFSIAGNTSTMNSIVDLLASRGSSKK